MLFRSLTPDDDRAAPEDYGAFSNPIAVSGVGAAQAEIALNPTDGSIAQISPASDLVIGLTLAPDRQGILLDSLGDGSIRLFETLTGQEVAFSANTTAGFDSLTITPVGGFAENTSYTLAIDGARDRGAVGEIDGATRDFLKFTTTFVTGAAPVVTPSGVAFADTVEATSALLTSVAVSPDGGWLYAASLTGEIKRWAIDPADGGLSGEQTLTLSYFQQDNGPRGIIGLAFDPTNPSVLWVTDNEPVPLSGRDNGVPDFSGRLSKITLDAGAAFTGAAETYLKGLPRSNGDHVTNSVVFRANPEAGAPGQPDFLLYLTQGSNSSMGEANAAWGFRPERLLSPAILEIDTTRTAPEGGFDLTTEPLPDDGLNRRFGYTDVVDGVLVPTDDGDLKNGGIAIDSGPFAGKFLHFGANGVATVREGAEASSALTQAFYNPFAPDAVAKIFATGARNAYDLVWHSNGFLYAPTNGSASGGATPDNPATVENEGLVGVGRQDDYLFKVVEGAFLGHANPLRDQFVVAGGNPTAGVDPNEIALYPVGTQPETAYDPSLAYSLGASRSPNGAIEYKSAVFGDLLNGALIFAEYSAGNALRAVLFDGNGDVAQDFQLRDAAGDLITYADPLDVIEGADGRLYLLTLDRATGQSLIVLLEPTPLVGDISADEDGDLRLGVVSGANPAQTVLDLDGVDADIVAASVSIDGGPAQALTRDAQDRFIADLSAFSGRVTAAVTVTDDAGNTATTQIWLTVGAGSVTIDAPDFTIVSEQGGSSTTIARVLDDPSTHEAGGNNDFNGDGLNDNFDGRGYVDFNGSAEDKISFTFEAPAAGVYDVALRLANGSSGARPIAVKLGDQTIAVPDTRTGSFTTWQDRVVTLTLAAGVNTIVVTQTGGAGPNIDSATVTPVAIGPVIAPDGAMVIDGDPFNLFEAEDAFLFGAAAVNAGGAGASGDAFVTFTPGADQMVTWLAEVSETGEYALQIVYGLPSTEAARPMTLLVDGVVVEILPFAPGASPSAADWSVQEAALTLEPGVHTIALLAPSGVGPAIDQLRLGGAPIVFEPVFAVINGEGRIELEATDDTTLILSPTEATFYFTVSDTGRYAFDLAANPGAPNGQDITLFLSANGAPATQIGAAAFPGVDEISLFAGLEAGVDYALTVISAAPGADALDYLDVRSAPGAAITVQSLDAALFANRLQFNYIEDPTETRGTGNDRVYKDSGVVRLTNTGAEALEFFDVGLTGPFVLQNPTALNGLSLAVGASIDVTVLFDRSQYAAPTGSNGAIDNTSTVFTGSLDITTNDIVTPVASIDLAGFWQSVPESGMEPNVNEIFQVFGLGNFYEGLSLKQGGAKSVLGDDGVYRAVNDQEVLSSYWRIADGYDSATVTQIAAFHGPSPARIKLHAPGDIANTSDLYRHGDDYNQSLLPMKPNGGFSTSTFNNIKVPDLWDGDDVFGFVIANAHSTDPRLNAIGDFLVDVNDVRYRILSSTDASNFETGERVKIANLDLLQQGYYVRVLQAFDTEMNAIEHTYIIMQDYTGINFDYNDNVYIVQGITPAGFDDILV